MPLSFHDSLLNGSRAMDLRCGLLVYHSRSGGVWLTSHDVMLPEDGDGQGAPVLVSGQPITRELANILARGILQAMPTRVLLPENVLMWDGLRVAWWTPARRAKIWFDRRKMPQLAHVSRREVAHPALMWVAEPRRLHIYALAEDRRPGPETPLFQAPYLNTYPDGWACPGEVQYPRTIEPASLPEWEAAFMDSEGSMVCAPQLTLFPGGHEALWAAMVDAERFPAEALAPTQRTALDAINQEWAQGYGWGVEERIVPDGLEVAA